jgi:hypothetical protein
MLMEKQRQEVFDHESIEEEIWAEKRENVELRVAHSSTNVIREMA